MSQPPPPPPPGAAPPPPPAPAGRPAFVVGDAISYGWTAYWKNVGPMLLLALVIFAVNIAFGLVGNTIDSTFGSIVFQLLSFIVGIILAMGLIRASLAVCEGRTPQVSMLFETDGFGPYLVASILVGLGVFVGLILLIIPGIILAVMWQFFGYAIVQEPTTRATDAITRSAEITRGYRWPLFGLILLLLLINLVGLLACLVGVIFTYGITAVTVAYAYKTLSDQPVAMP
jgi:hypothetical protein